VLRQPPFDGLVDLEVIHDNIDLLALEGQRDRVQELQQIREQPKAIA